MRVPLAGLETNERQRRRQEYDAETANSERSVILRDGWPHLEPQESPSSRAFNVEHKTPTTTNTDTGSGTDALKLSLRGNLLKRGGIPDLRQNEAKIESKNKIHAPVMPQISSSCRSENAYQDGRAEDPTRGGSSPVDRGHILEGPKTGKFASIPQTLSTPQHLGSEGYMAELCTSS